MPEKETKVKVDLKEVMIPASELEKMAAAMEIVRKERDAALERNAPLEEQIAQLKTEIEAARKTADETLRREGVAVNKQIETQQELDRTVKALGNAVAEREKARKKADQFRMSLKGATAELEELKKPKEDPEP